MEYLSNVLEDAGPMVAPCSDLDESDTLQAKETSEMPFGQLVYGWDDKALHNSDAEEDIEEQI